MDSNKKTYNDNFSYFLDEYNSRYSDKKKWIDDKLKSIDSILEEIEELPENNFKDGLKSIRKVLKDSHLDTWQKVLLSIKEINYLIESKEDLPKDLLTLKTLRTIVSIYIEIALYTSNELIAKDVVNLGNNVNTQLK